METDPSSVSDQEDADVSTQSSSRQQDQDDERQNPVLDQQTSRAKKLRLLRQKNKISAFNNDINDEGIDDGDKKCSNPFACQTQFLTAGRRPRVKSNLRARKRNFWQKTKIGSGGEGVGKGFRGFRRGRKIRRGRKQRTDLDLQNKQVSSTVNVDDSQEDNKITQPAFFPTTRTTTTSTTTTTVRKETTTEAVKEEENEIFDDFFDSGNDFFAASSTVSPVVFKGSPGPGFFSSPRPFSDGQVFFGTSPSPFGPAPGGPVGRPSFDNIGAHIDLGPPQPASLPQQLLHISSTVSNKIFIGSEEDESTTTPAAPVTEPTPKRAFPSFPIRGGDTINIKQKLDFSRKTKSLFKFGRQPVTEDQDEVVTEQSDDVDEPTEATTTVESTETSTKHRAFVDLTGGKKPRVKSNLLFNKRKFPDNKERFRKKLALLKAKKNEEATTVTATEESVTEVESEPTEQSQAAVNKKKLKHKPFTFFGIGKAPAAPVSFTNALLKFKSRNKALKNKFSVTSSPPVTGSSVLSVETELSDDDDETVDKVRKASRAPANGNIRVEFKKKVEEDNSLGLKGKFFINPDGRKPRVKSNIRAKLANRGQQFGEESEEETFDGASSQLDLTPFNKNIDNTDTEEDITEKREVNNAEAPSAAIFNQIQSDIKTDLVPPPPPPTAQFSHDLPLFSLTPLTLNTRQSRRQDPGPASIRQSPEKPPLPAAILKHINHITDIRSLPPLPPLFRSPKLKLSKPVVTEPATEATEPATTPSSNNSLLEKMLVTDNKSQSTPQTSSSSSSVSAAAPASSSSNKLSAFRALQQQVEKNGDNQVETTSSSQDILV